MLQDINGGTKAMCFYTFIEQTIQSITCQHVYVCVCMCGLQSCCWLAGGGVWRRGRSRFRPRHLNLCKMNKKMYCFRSSGLSFLSMRGVGRLTSVCAAWAAVFSAPAGGRWGTGFLQPAARWQPEFAHASPCLARYGR